MRVFECEIKCGVYLCCVCVYMYQSICVRRTLNIYMCVFFYLDVCVCFYLDVCVCMCVCFYLDVLIFRRVCVFLFGRVCAFNLEVYVCVCAYYLDVLCVVQ